MERKPTSVLPPFCPLPLGGSDVPANGESTDGIGRRIALAVRQTFRLDPLVDVKEMLTLLTVLAVLVGCGDSGGGNGNDAPTRVAVSNISVSDRQPTAGGFVVGTLYTDGLQDQSAISFSITGGADAAEFSVSANSLIIENGGILQAADQDQYEVTVRATDGGGSSVDGDFTILVIESDPLTIGYYDTSRNTGQPEQATPITFIGETAVNVGDFATADLGGLDMLFVQNPISAPPGAPYADAANLAKVESFVSNGGILIFHDRHVNTIENFLPGSPGDLVADSGATRLEFEVIDDLTHLALGPGGIIDDDNLESANSLTFGYVDARSVPPGSMGLLSRNDPNHWTTYAYPFGRGYVIYSSIPLDFYLLSANPPIMQDVYAPNILAQARAILKKSPDDDADGLSNVEEAVLGTNDRDEDSDGDTLLDIFEVRNGLDPLVPGDQNVDNDRDGLTNRAELLAGTLPRQADSDGDGLSDGDEVNVFRSNSLVSDTDGDLLSDSDEVFVYFTDLNLFDTDSGGAGDGREVLLDGTDPLRASDDRPLASLPLTLTDVDGFIWDIQTNGRINNGSIDAYDGGMRLFINGFDFPTFSEASELQAGREVEMGLASMSGLIVSRRVFVPDDEAYVRYLEILRNQTDADISIELEINTNLGSDSATVIVTTSNGDAVIEPTDFWVTTDDASDGAGDPSLAHVIAGPGAATIPLITAPLGLIMYTYSLTVPANDRVIVMHFDSQNANRTAAVISADFLLDLGSGRFGFSGISAEEQADIVNFDL